MVTDFGVNDIVKMKKPHPCGCDEWRIIRVGMDIKIKCLGCSRIVMLSREVFLKRAKKIVKNHEEA